MTVQLDQVPADLTSAGTPRPDLVHVVCHDLNTALCGADVSREPWTSSRQDVTCELCDLAESNDLPCGTPDCPRTAHLKEAP